MRVWGEGGAEVSAELDQQKSGYVVSVQDSRDERHSRVDIGDAREKEKKKKLQQKYRTGLASTRGVVQPWIL